MTVAYFLPFNVCWKISLEFRPEILCGFANVPGLTMQKRTQLCSAFSILHIVTTYTNIVGVDSDANNACSCGCKNSSRPSNDNVRNKNK